MIDDRAGPEYFDHLRVLNPGVGSSGAYEAAALRFEEEVGRILPPDKNCRILEVGSGFGYFAEYLANKGYSRVCISDIDRKLLDFSVSRIGERIENHFLGPGVDVLSSVECGFDYIFSFDVIEHMTEEEAIRFTRLAYERLGPGGALIMRTPNMANILGNYSRHIDLTHKAGFTEFSLAQLSRLGGFERFDIVEPKYIGLRRRLFAKFNNLMHRIVFHIQDRSHARTFGKNIVVAFVKS